MVNDQNKVLQNLKSGDFQKVIEAIEELRVSGKTSDIPVLLELLQTTQNHEVKSKVFSLLANLKDRNSIPMIVEAIQDQRYGADLKQLISCCWENGLDFSNYLSVFVDLLIESDFVFAFEAYTVITNMTQTIDQAKIDIEIEKLDHAIRTTTDEKKVLMLDVIDFLPSVGF